MGMDVCGKKPTSEEGEYFCNNVHAWRSLAEYIYEVAPDSRRTSRSNAIGVTTTAMVLTLPMRSSWPTVYRTRSIAEDAKIMHGAPVMIARGTASFAICSTKLVCQSSREWTTS
jgi:hypothetical protein